MYRVEWLRAAVVPVATALRDADAALRIAIRQAVTEIGIQLRSNPELKGESRSGGRRILLAAPLGIIFRVNSQTQSVLVVRAWVFRQGKGRG